MTHLSQLVYVGAGGCLGAMTRHLLGGVILHRSGNWNFPLGTLIINLVGCLAIGLLGGLAERHHSFSPEARLFLVTGLLGGFTTFSAFGFETLYLLRRGEWGFAATYVGVSVLIGVVAVGAGLALIGARR